jgi:hypothetical protein
MPAAALDQQEAEGRDREAAAADGRTSAEEEGQPIAPAWAASEAEDMPPLRT